MDFFATPITTNPNATAETIERKHTIWNKGLKGLQYHTEESRRRLAEAQRGRKVSEETRAKISGPKTPDQMRNRYGVIQTPLGQFIGRSAAGRAHGMSAQGIAYRMEMCPDQYFWIVPPPHHGAYIYSAEANANRGRAQRGKKQTAERIAKRIPAMLRNEFSAKSVMTPKGQFSSNRKAAQAYGKPDAWIYYQRKVNPNLFYVVETAK